MELCKIIAEHILCNLEGQNKNTDIGRNEMRFWNKIKQRLKIRKQLKEIKLKEQIKELKTSYGTCSKCGRQFKNFTDKYRCNYCHKYFCSDHRLPEKHNCSGNPQPPPHVYRVLISGEERKTIGK